MMIENNDSFYYPEIKDYTRILKAFPNNIRFLERRAGWHFERSAWKKAAKDYERLVELAPGNFKYWALLGQACVHGRMPEKAIAACTRAIELDPDFDLPYMHRGWAYRQLKQWDASIADYTKAWEDNIKNHDSAYHSTLFLGELYKEMGEYEKAVDLYLRAINISSGYPLSYYCWLIIAYMKMKQYDNVIEYVNKALELEEPTEFLLEQRATAYKKIGLKEKAEADIDLLRQIKEKQDKESDEEYSNRMEEEEKYSDLQQKENVKFFKEKVPELTHIISVQPKNAEAYFNRGCVYFANAYIKKALIDCNKAISINNEFLEAYELRGEIYSLLGEIEKEIADCEKILKLYPDDVMPFSAYNLGELYAETGRFEQAVEFYTKHYLYDELEYFDSILWFEYCNYYRGDIIRKLSAAILNDPQNAAIYLVRGKNYLENNKCVKAISDFTEAIRLRPDLFLAYFFRSVSFAFMDNYQSAIDDLSHCLNQKEFRIPSVFAVRGRLYFESGDYSKAIEDYSTAIENKEGKLDYGLKQYLEERGKCYEAIHEDDKAKIDFMAAAELEV